MSINMNDHSIHDMFVSSKKKDLMTAKKIKDTIMGERFRISFNITLGKLPFTSKLTATSKLSSDANKVLYALFTEFIRELAHLHKFDLLTANTTQSDILAINFIDYEAYIVDFCKSIYNYNKKYSEEIDVLITDNKLENTMPMLTFDDQTKLNQPMYIVLSKWFNAVIDAISRKSAIIGIFTTSAKSISDKILLSAMLDLGLNYDVITNIHKSVDANKPVKQPREIKPIDENVSMITSEITEITLDVPTNVPTNDIQEITVDIPINDSSNLNKN